MAADKVAVLKAFVDMVLGEGQDMLKDFSFDKVPAAMNLGEFDVVSLSQELARGEEIHVLAALEHNCPTRERARISICVCVCVRERE